MNGVSTRWSFLLPVSGPREEEQSIQSREGTPCSYKEERAGKLFELKKNQTCFEVKGHSADQEEETTLAPAPCQRDCEKKKKESQTFQIFSQAHGLTLHSREPGVDEIGPSIQIQYSDPGLERTKTLEKIFFKFLESSQRPERPLPTPATRRKS